ncbi:MAG: DUF929 family protein [Proteobacteria bacterium]|nr:DUF929 family protein [Pseudomonadota bacterium]
MLRSVRLTAILTAAATLAFASAASAQLNFFGLSAPKTPVALADKLNMPVATELLTTLARASHLGLDFRAKPDAAELKAIPGSRLTTDGKPGLLYVGADYCPYCAGERWGVMLTLLRFGKLSGLRYMLSSANDVYPNTPTVTFQHASYQSPSLDFQVVETADRAEQPLMTLSPSQMKIMSTFDAPPYKKFIEPIPFVDLDGKYELGQLLAMPKPLAGNNWQQVANRLANPRSALFQSVMPRVNLLTAAICHRDGGKPVDVCTAPGVVAANRVFIKG